MTSPKGTGWQHLRSLCFSAIPVDAAAYHVRAVPLHDWRLRGSYQVLACSKKSITIEAAGIEIGSALLADAEHLLDHAAEQHATLRSFITEPAWHSPAWASVTAYYWAFFSALAITRITGRTTWHLRKLALTDLRKLASAVAQPSAGALFFDLGPPLSAMNRTVVLQPSGLHLHSAVWKRFEGLLSEVFLHSDQSASPLEYRMLRSLHEVFVRLGFDWPSEVRNLVNYRPGYAYREVIRDTPIDAASFIRRKSPLTFEALVSSMEDEVVKVKPSSGGGQDLGLSCRILVLFAVTLAKLARELHSELVDRNSTDRRWVNLRRAFLQAHCQSEREFRHVWPLAVD